MLDDNKLKSLQAKINSLTLMNDTFMTKVFENNIPCTELLLRTILRNDKIRIVKVIGQYSIKNLQGRSIRLDIFAQDEFGKYFNVEVQRVSNGAIPQRARYHAALIDANHLPQGQDYSSLKDCCVIFITEKDALGANLPIYHIERTIKENGKSFSDGSHIIYVNGAIQDTSTALGRLMHDFFCVNPQNMYNQILAERSSYFKHDKGGVDEMSDIIREIAAEMAEDMVKDMAHDMAKDMAKNMVKETVHEEKLNFAKKLLLEGFNTAKTASLAGVPLSDVKRIEQKLASGSPA